MRYFYYFLLLLLTGVIIVWAFDAYTGRIPYLDQWTEAFAENMAGTKLYAVFRWFTEFGSGSFLFPFVVIISFLVGLMYRDWFSGGMVASGVIVCYLLNYGIKFIVARDRPRVSAAADAVGYSFPSGHSMLSIVCYGLFVYFMVGKLRTRKAAVWLEICFALLVLMIGLSRYIIRVHYLTDVIAGFGIGLLYLMIWVRVYRYVQRLRGRRTPETG